jgi:hypothetical protein
VSPLVAAIRRDTVRVGAAAVLDPANVLREDDSAGDLLTTRKGNARLVVLARDAADMGSIAANWTPLPPDRSSALWTDDYSNILGAMLRRKFGG